jgi:hypothetical protein
MGLNTTHDCWNGPYSSFHEFRTFLAKQINIDLDRQIEFGGDLHDLNETEHGIIPLLNHSDCDGKLTVDECKSIITGLDDIISKMKKPEEMNKASREYHFRISAVQFRNGCQKAFDNNEEVEFL